MPAQEVKRAPWTPGRSVELSDERLLVLLVEDHEDTRRIMVRLLVLDGYKVVAAGSVAEAMEKIESVRFDLLIADWTLPDGSGAEVLAAMEERGRTPAIAITGRAMPEDVDASRAAGFTCHLSKPVSFANIRIAIHAALHGGAEACPE